MIKDCDHVVAEAEARMDAYRKRVVVLEAENKELRAALEASRRFLFDDSVSMATFKASAELRKQIDAALAAK